MKIHQLLSNVWALVGLVVLGILWSTHILFAKLANIQNMQDALSFMVWYLGTHSLIIVSLFYMFYRHLPRVSRAGVFFLVSAVFGFVLPVQLDLFLAPQLPLSHLSLIVGSGSMMALLIGWMMRIERPHRWRFFGVGLGFVAVMVLFVDTSANPEAQDFSFSFWYPLALLLPFSYAFGDCYIDKYWPKHYSTFEVAAGDSLVAFMLLLVIVIGYALLNQLSPLESLTAARDIIAQKPLLLIGLTLSALISVVLFYAMLNRYGAVFVSAAIYPALFSGVLLGAVLFDEAIAPQFLLALVLMVIGLVIIRLSRDSNRRQKR